MRAEVARARRAARKANDKTAKGRRRYTRWSGAEMARLMKLWLQYPNDWARIKEIDRTSSDPKLGMRTDVDLKDKLRTIKMWCLK